MFLLPDTEKQEEGVRKVIPVEQGLRLPYTLDSNLQVFVRKVIPVEQGLRHNFDNLVV